MYIYILHYRHNLSHAQHYIGITDDPHTRIASHATGQGSAFTREMACLKIPFTIGMLAQVSTAKARQYERTLKSTKNAHRYCTCCSQVPLQMKGTLRVDFAAPETPERKRVKSLEIRHAYTAGNAIEIARKIGDGLGFLPIAAVETYAREKRIAYAIQDGETVGYTAWSLDRKLTEQTIVQIGVLDECRLKGIGRSLLDYARACWPRTTTVAKVRSDLSATFFWERYGFSLLQTRRHRTSGRPANYYQMASITHTQNGSTT